MNERNVKALTEMLNELFQETRRAFPHLALTLLDASTLAEALASRGVLVPSIIEAEEMPLHWGNAPWVRAHLERIAKGEA